jgi:hypothetical protein
MCRRFNSGSAHFGNGLIPVENHGRIRLFSFPFRIRQRDRFALIWTQIPADCSAAAALGTIFFDRIQLQTDERIYQYATASNAPVSEAPERLKWHDCRSPRAIGVVRRDEEMFKFVSLDGCLVSHLRESSIDRPLLRHQSKKSDLSLNPNFKVCLCRSCSLGRTRDSGSP